jgi:small nuclear ribonucleoprotein (snRNP)-like protein
MQSGHNYIKSLGYNLSGMRYKMWTFNHGIYVFNQTLNKPVLIEIGKGICQTYNTYELKSFDNNVKIILVDTRETGNFSKKIYTEIYGDRLVYNPEEFLLLKLETLSNKKIFCGI